MPTGYRIDERTGIVYFAAVGTTTEQDWIETRSRITADPRFRPGISALIDTRRHESILSTQFVRNLAASLKARCGREDVPRCAIVVSRNVSYGLGRMFALHTEPSLIEVRVFRDIDNAEKWLKEARGSRESSPAVDSPGIQGPAG